MNVAVKELAMFALCAMVSACATESPELSGEVDQLRQQNQQLQAQIATINNQLGLDAAHGTAPPVHENQPLQLRNVRGESGGLCLSTQGIASPSYIVYAVPCAGSDGPSYGAQRWTAAPTP